MLKKLWFSKMTTAIKVVVVNGNLTFPQRTMFIRKERKGNNKIA